MGDFQNVRMIEIYATLGYALFHAQLLEHSLVNAIVMIRLMKDPAKQAVSQSEWKNYVDKVYAKQWEKTFGGMRSDFTKLLNLSAAASSKLTVAVQQRNWLIHHFSNQRGLNLYSPQGRIQIMSELSELVALFTSCHNDLNETLQPYRVTLGLTEEKMERLWREFIERCPLPIDEFPGR